MTTRATLIHGWLTRITRTRDTLQRWEQFLQEAQAQSPDEVNADAFFSLIQEADKALYGLSHQIEADPVAELFEAVTSRNIWFTEMEAAIKAGKCDAHINLTRLDLLSFSDQYPQEIDRLLTLLEARVETTT